MLNPTVPASSRILRLSLTISSGVRLPRCSRRRPPPDLGARPSDPHARSADCFALSATAVGYATKTFVIVIDNIFGYWLSYPAKPVSGRVYAARRCRRTPVPQRDGLRRQPLPSPWHLRPGQRGHHHRGRPGGVAAAH